MTGEQQAKLNEKYGAAWTDTKGLLDHLERIVMKDFPIPEGIKGYHSYLREPTKYDLAMALGLKQLLQAAVDGYESKS